MPQILYNDKPEIRLSELAHIYLSLIFSADTVYINRNISVSTNQPKEAIDHTEDCLHQLREKGLVKYWAYPFDAPSLHVPDLVMISAEDYHFWEGVINETFLSGKNLVSVFNVMEPHKREFQGGEDRTSKIVSIKKEYWALATCLSLKLDQILNGYRGSQPQLDHRKKYDFSRIKEPLLKKLFARFDVPDLSVLRAPDIEKLQKKAAVFRSLMDSKILANEGNADEETVNVIFDELAGEIFELCDDYIGNSGIRALVDSTFMAFISLWISIYSFLSVGTDVIEELSRRNKYGFVYLVSEIKTMANKRRGQKRK